MTLAVIVPAIVLIGSPVCVQIKLKVPSPVAVQIRKRSPRSVKGRLMVRLGFAGGLVASAKPLVIVANAANCD